MVLTRLGYNQLINFPVILHDDFAEQGNLP
jgi:hypothetical protein